MHYQELAIIIGSINSRKRQYVFEYNGKRYKKNVFEYNGKRYTNKIYQMLIPEQTMLMIDVTTLDVTDSRESGAKPKLHTNGAELHEEDLILCKTDLTDIEWYLTQINKIYSDEVEIIYFTTPTKVVENYIEQSMEQRSENLRSARSWKT